MEKFLKINNIGQLYYDKILFSSHYPILFTCKDNNKNLYLSVCYHLNTDGQKWLITKTDEIVIIRLLQNEISLRKAFLVYEDIQISALLLNGQYVFKYNDKIDWNYETSIALPDKDEFIDAEENEFDEEISYFRNLKIERILNTQKYISKNTDNIFDKNIDYLSLSQNAIPFSKFDFKYNKNSDNCYNGYSSKQNIILNVNNCLNDNINNEYDNTSILNKVIGGIKWQ